MHEIEKKQNWHRFKGLLFFTLCFCSLLLSSCSSFNEDLDACHRLTLKAVNANGDDITGSGDVSAVSLFVFDAAYNYLQTVEMSAQQIVNRQEIILDYPKNSTLHLIAWGNASTDRYVITKGLSMEEFALQLQSDGGLAATQDNELFYGNKAVSTALFTLVKDEEIVIRPKTASVYMWTQGLSYYNDKLRREGLRSDGAEPFDCDFFLDKTLSAYNHEGVLQGDSVYYNPSGEWTDAAYSDWRTPESYKIFAGENMSAALALDGQVYDTVLTDDEGNPISVKETEEVLVVFVWGEDGTYLGARVTVRPWQYVDDPVIME